MKTVNTRYTNEAEQLSYTDLAPRTFSASCGAKLEALKERLVQRLAAEFSDLQSALVRRAVDEAGALASLTVIPHLLLPTLAEEKVQIARSWNLRQQEIFRRSSLALSA